MLNSIVYLVCVFWSNSAMHLIFYGLLWANKLGLISERRKTDRQTDSSKKERKSFFLMTAVCHWRIVQTQMWTWLKGEEEEEEKVTKTPELTSQDTQCTWLAGWLAGWLAADQNLSAVVDLVVVDVRRKRKRLSPFNQKLIRALLLLSIVIDGHSVVPATQWNSTVEGEERTHSKQA